MPFFRVALTGNVAAGKSTVLDLFKSWGAAVTDADAIAHDAVAPGTPGLAAIVQRFGPGMLLGDGTLDRAALRRRVMQDPAERGALNAIVHPEVARRAAEAEDAFRRAGVPMVVHDIPLLFEVLDPAGYDAVVLVDAPLEVRRERLARRGLLPSDADAIITSQMPPEAKRARSDFVIANGGSREALESRTREVWTELQGRAGLA